MTILTIRIFSIITLLLVSQGDSFKSEQLRYARVRKAYKVKGSSMQQLLQRKEIKANNVQVYLRAFKKEKELEVWAKIRSNKTYKLIKTYKVCKTSGKLGPKRREGDLQIPEGYYHINRFNPNSNFLLSLGLNYPNKSDKILGGQKLGGDIFIHGSCVTIGCLPITNTEIQELYILCIEAKNNGQKRIPITVFPARLSMNQFLKLHKQYANDIDKRGLWTDLKEGYDFFNKHKKLPNIGFKKNGRHIISH